MAFQASDRAGSGASGRNVPCQIESCPEAGEITRRFARAADWTQTDTQQAAPDAERAEDVSSSKRVLRQFQSCLLFGPELSGAEEEQGCAKALCQQHTPSAGNNFTGVRRISRPG
jgi:hypothetical protein